MKPKKFLLLIFCVVVYTGCAQMKSHKKPVEKVYFSLLESYTQQTVPGVRGGVRPNPTTNFVLIWQNKDYPETFFWKGEVGWLTCKMQKAHKITDAERMRNMPKGLDYLTEIAGGDGIHQGDTLLLTAIPGGKFPIPAEIPDTAKNYLFFKTGGSAWLKYHVDAITKKHDLITP